MKRPLSSFYEQTVHSILPLLQKNTDLLTHPLVGSAWACYDRTITRGRGQAEWQKKTTNLSNNPMIVH